MSNKKAALELGTKPVSSLLMQYALPAIVAMVATSLYNMVDSIFIGQGVGPLAISGLAITFPFMNLSAAFGAAIGVGASTLLSVKLGQRDYAIANKILGNNVMLNIVVGIALGVIGLLFLDPILLFFGASEATLPYARDYMQVILVGNAITHLTLGLNAVLRSAGKPKVAMYITIFTVVINAILDPIFIYTLQLGIKGAAYATILAQLLAVAWQWVIFSDKKELLHFEYDKFHLERKIVSNIVSIGISPFAMNACACICEQQPADLWRRHGSRCVRNSQPRGICLCDDNDGRMPGYAAYSRLQLWRTELQQNVGGAEAGGNRRHVCLCRGLRHCNGFPKGVCKDVYYRRDADSPLRCSYAIHHGDVPYNRSTDGDNKLLSIHRQGEDKHLPQPLATADIPGATDSSATQEHGAERSVVGHASL